MSAQIRSFNQDFDAIVTVHGERTALIPAIDGRSPLSYEELDGLIHRHLAWFRQLGLQPGERVGALLPNSVEMLTLFIACLRGGYGFAPLACDTTTVEAEKWARLIRPHALIVSSIVSKAILQNFESSQIRAHNVSIDGKFSYLPGTLSTDSSELRSGAKLYLFTSGTTGQPKAVVLDGDRLWSAGHHFIRQHGINFDQTLRIWNYLPQSYLGGLFNLCLIPMSVAGSVVVDESFSGKTFLGFWQTVDRYDLTALWFVPTIVRGLLSLAEKTHRHEAKSYQEKIKSAFLGTAPIELATKRRFEELFGIPLLENYGLSETTFITTEKLSTVSKRAEGTVGPVSDEVEIAFRPVAGEPDPSFQEILVRTPFLFDGYLDMDGNLSPKFENSFFPTGDTGYLDENGQLVLSGRCKDIIKKGGQLISLREIEVAAMEHPLVRNASAVSVPHPFYGESYYLYVQLTPEEDAGSVDRVRNFVYENVAKHKWPEKVEAVVDFPSTDSGKVKKYLLTKNL